MYMDRLLQDLRYAIRMMLRNPGFTAVAVIALAIGIGANTAIFSVTYAALAKSMPFADADHLVDVSMTKLGGVRNMEASYPNLLDWRAQAKSFSIMAGYARNGVLLSRNGESEPLSSGAVTGNFFNALQVTPAQGRLFHEGEETSGAKRVVITQALSQRLFSGAGAVGSTLTLDGEANEIVGVLPPSFQFSPLGSPELFVLVPNKGQIVTRRNLHWIHVVARLKPGVTLDQAAAEMTSISNSLAAQYPTTNANTGVRVQPLRNVVVGDIRPILLVLMAAVGFVLLIACVNVANLLLTRAKIRQREIAIRTALGASRGDLVRQLLTESVLLACIGGAAGIGLAIWGVDALLSRIPTDVINTMPYLRNTTVGRAPLLFTMAVSVISGILFGLAPAWKISGDAPQEALKESGGLVGTTRNRVGLALVTAQVSLSIVLLIGAGLMVKSLIHMLDTDPGFRTDHLLMVKTFLPSPKYDKDPQEVQAAHELQAALTHLPGVVGVAYTNQLALQGGNTIRMQAEGAPAQSAGEQPEGNIRVVGPNYFQVLGARMLHGRSFAESDNDKAPKVVIINRTLAKILFGTEDAVGKRLRFTYSPEEKYREVVGVVANIQEERGLDSGDKPALYAPFDQEPTSAVSLAVRTEGDPKLSTAGSACGRPVGGSGDRALAPGTAVGIDRQFLPDVPAPLSRDARVDVWLRRARACDGGPVRNHLVLGVAADARDRHSHGARRTETGRAATVPRTGRSRYRTWRGDWSGGRRVRGAHYLRVAVRRESGRPDHFFEFGRAAGVDGTDSNSCACLSCQPRGPKRSATTRVVAHPPG
jgi:putative ABC transport system permease protein